MTDIAVVVITCCVVFLFCLYLWFESREEDDSGRKRFNPHKLGFVLQKTFICCPTRLSKKVAKLLICCGYVGTSCLEHIEAPDDEDDVETGRKMKLRKKRSKKSSSDAKPSFHQIASSDDEERTHEVDLEIPVTSPIIPPSPPPIQSTNPPRVPSTVEVSRQPSYLTPSASVPAPIAPPPLPVHQRISTSSQAVKDRKPASDVSSRHNTSTPHRTQRSTVTRTFSPVEQPKERRRESNNGRHQEGEQSLLEACVQVSPLTVDERDNGSIGSELSDTRIDLSSHSSIKSTLLLPASEDLKHDC